MIRRCVRQFFICDNGARSEVADPLVAVVHRYPVDAVRFIKVVMLMGFGSGVFTSIPCGIFLLLNWAACGSCNRPLRYWVLIHSILQLCHAPIRLVFFSRLCNFEHDLFLVQTCVEQMTRSTAWKFSKALSIVTYGWFILGVVWLLNSTACGACPSVYRISFAVVVVSIVKLLATLFVFYRAFPAHVQVTEDPAEKPRGASEAVIDELPLVCCMSTDGLESSCAVCLSDFERGQMVRRLPCNHSFHRACIDRWLKLNKVCPLCFQDVEVLTTQRRRSHRTVDE